jgi:hypothetical protein
MIRPAAAIFRTDPPEQSLLAASAGGPGVYFDAFRTDIRRTVDLPAYLEVFYRTPVFRSERALLAAAGFRSVDADVSALARGETDCFVAWRVTARGPSEILLHDVSGRTASWFLVEPIPSGTRLWFGSLVRPAEGRGAPRLGRTLRLLLGPHRVYSRILLAAAAARLETD